MSVETEELYKRLRPKKLADVAGQDAAVKTLKSFGVSKVPHTVLFSGPSGCGKTTTARILARQVGCEDSEITEINCADSRGIELARDLRRKANSYPLSGKFKVFILDEVQSTTKDFQSSMLRLLEFTPDHVYFFLATTDPQKLLPTIVTRCTEIRLKSLSPSEIKAVLERAIRLAKLSIHDDTVSNIINESEGSARKALVLLNQIKDIDDPEEQADAVSKSSHRSKGIELAKALVSPRTQWKEVADILKNMDEEMQVESIRHLVLSYCNKILLGGGGLSARMAFVLDRFQSNFYDSKSAGLSLACYEVITAAPKK